MSDFFKAMRTATGRRALYGRGGYDPCEAGVCARFPCTSQERWPAPSRRETLLLLPLVPPATVDRLQRSTFVDSTSEERPETSREGKDGVVTFRFGGGQIP